MNRQAIAIFSTLATFGGTAASAVPAAATTSRPPGGPTT